MLPRFSSIIPTVTALLLLYGCAKEQSVSYGSLEVTSVEASEPISKAAIDGTGFPSGSSLGLSLFTDMKATTPYHTSGATNIKYSYDSSKWTASPSSIKVGSTQGYLYGYFPHKDNTDIKSIPIASSLNGDDVMYASPQDGAITAQNAANTSLKMKHALARVTVSIKKDNSYSGNAELSKIVFSGAKTAESGTLNAVNGNISVTSRADVTLDVTGNAQTIASGTGTTYECLLVPSEKYDTRQTVTLKMTIDGGEKSVTLSEGNGVIIKSGIKSTVTLTLSGTGLAVSTVSIDDWQTVEVGGHKVTVTKPSGHDVLMDIYKENDNVMVKATSSAGDVLKMDMKSGDASIGINFDPDKRVHTFTISNIKSDIQADITTAKAWNVSVNIQPFGAGSVSGAGKYEKGTQAKLTAKPEQNYQFWHWLDKDGKVVMDNPEYTTPSLTSDCTYTAVFIPQFAVKSVFTVNSNGAKVHFARGNLWYSKSYPYWGVENEQYSSRTYSGNSGTPENTFGLFGWGDVPEDGFEIKTDENDQDYSWTKDKDWGTKLKPENSWRTLSKDEWEHIIEKRGGVAQARFAAARIKDGENVKVGLLLIPDGYTVSSEQTTINNITIKNVNDADAWCCNNDISQDDWNKLEAKGVVFLPNTGQRNVTEIKFPNTGKYWSSTPSGGNESWVLDFCGENSTPESGNKVDLTNTYRHYGCAVRLVTDCK